MDSMLELNLKVDFMRLLYALITFSCLDWSVLYHFMIME